MFKQVEGDLFAGNYDAIGHGVNVYGVMGAGIALSFKQKYPLMYEEYKIMCKHNDLLPGDLFKYYAGDEKWVYNLASQSMPGPHARLTWLEQSANSMMYHANRYGLREVALPAIGAGIGGLSFNDVKESLEKIATRWSSPNLTLVVYKP